MRTLGVIVGFLVAPLAVVVLQCLISRSLAGFALLWFAYPFALILGIPSYILFRFMGWIRFWQTALAGIVLGFLSGLFVLWNFGGLRVSWGSLLLPLYASFQGALVASVFWAIAIREKPLIRYN